MQEQIFLSVITVNLNNKNGLIKTINSVINQTYNNFEYIIIDGESIDGSIEVINRNKDKLSFWIIEPDSGIYHAMNKGMKKASGKYILFLNSGDYLINDNVIYDIFKYEHNEDILYGSINNDFGNYQQEVQYPKEQYITFRHFIKSTLPHPSTFVKRELFERVGLFNEKLTITADWEFLLLALFKHNASLKRLDFAISVFDTNGLSSKPQFHDIIKDERKVILEKNFGRFITDYLYFDKLEKTIPFRFYKWIKSLKRFLWK